MPLRQLSRRRFALTAASTAATAAAAQAQKKKEPEPEAQPSERSSPPAEPCVRNPVLGDFPVPMSTEPAFGFQA